MFVYLHKTNNKKNESYEKEVRAYGRDDGVIRSNDKWRAGDFYGTGDELIHKAYKHGETPGREYERIV